MSAFRKMFPKYTGITKLYSLSTLPRPAVCRPESRSDVPAAVELYQEPLEAALQSEAAAFELSRDR